jgi:hypothetical protein
VSEIKVEIEINCPWVSHENDVQVRRAARGGNFAQRSALGGQGEWWTDVIFCLSRFEQWNASQPATKRIALQPYQCSFVSRVMHDCVDSFLRLSALQP